MTEHAPLYDPAIHKADDGDPMVFAELYCKCGGGVFKQRDPVSYITPRLRDFLARHTGDRHGPATKAEFAAAREIIREAAHVAAGTPDDYTPWVYTHLEIDDAPRPWPQLEG